MKNYEMVQAWAATLTTQKAMDEITNLKLKYPWLKCDEAIQFIQKMHEDLPKILNIIKLQEKQNAIHRRFIETSRLTDLALVEAIQKQYNL